MYVTCIDATLCMVYWQVWRTLCAVQPQEQLKEIQVPNKAGEVGNGVISDHEMWMWSKFIHGA